MLAAHFPIVQWSFDSHSSISRASASEKWDKKASIEDFFSKISFKYL